MSKHLVLGPLVASVLVCFALAIAPGIVHAQSANDTSAVGPLRPRYGSYLIPPFPSPSSSRVPTTIEFYNHNPEILAVKIFDVRNALIQVVHEKQQTERGLHRYTIDPHRLASGVYFVRLTTYTPAGAENTIDNVRFVVVH